MNAKGEKMKSNGLIDLKIRTKEFALQTIQQYSTLPTTTEADVPGRESIRSGTSVGAHYREAQRAKSDADFISKIEGALQELDETAYWLELLEDSKIIAKEKPQFLRQESNELISILVTVVKSVKSRKQR